MKVGYVYEIGILNRGLLARKYSIAIQRNNLRIYLRVFSFYKAALAITLIKG
jgi:hypothetical protein